MNRPAYILRYWETACTDQPTTPLRSAIAGGLLHCLTIEQTLQLVLTKNTIDKRLRDKALGSLLGQVAEAAPEKRDFVMNELLEALADTPYPQKVSVAFFLESIYTSMPRNRQDTIVRIFLSWQQRGMRKRAYKLLRREWNPKWESDIRRCWEEWHELESALLIVEHFDVLFLIQHIKELEVDLIDGSYVARLYIRACSVDDKLLGRLKRFDGITYAYVSSRLSKSISKRVAKQLMRRYEYDERLGILAWSLGKLGHWDLLEELSTNVEKLEKEKRHLEFERLGLEYPYEEVQDSQNV